MMKGRQIKARSFDVCLSVVLQRKKTTRIAPEITPNEETEERDDPWRMDQRRTKRKEFELKEKREEGRSGKGKKGSTTHQKQHPHDHRTKKKEKQATTSSPDQKEREGKERKERCDVEKKKQAPTSIP